MKLKEQSKTTQLSEKLREVWEDSEEIRPCLASELLESFSSKS